MSSWPNHLQSPGVPSHTQVREPQSAMRRQEQPPVQVLWSPCSAMEAMNQSGQPRKSGKRGPMQPAPLTSGGLALEEITCRGWGPHLQYSFLIKLASLSCKYFDNDRCQNNRSLKNWWLIYIYNLSACTPVYSVTNFRKTNNLAGCTPVYSVTTG